MALRPEKIAVASPQNMTQDCVLGRVQEVVYIVRLTDQTSIVARVQNLGKETIINYAPGTEVALSWEQSTARILTT